MACYITPYIDFAERKEKLKFVVSHQVLRREKKAITISNLIFDLELDETR